MIRFVILHKVPTIVIILISIVFVTIGFACHVNDNLNSKISNTYRISDRFLAEYYYTLDIKHNKNWHIAYRRSNLNNIYPRYSLKHAHRFGLHYKHLLVEKDSQGLDDPASFLSRYHDKQDEANELKRSRKLNIIDVYNIVPFSLFFIIMIILLFKISEFKTRYLVDDIKRDFNEDELKQITKFFKYKIRRYYFTQIINDYLFLLFPLIISVLSIVGSNVGLSSSNNFIEFIMSSITKYSVILLSFCQFIRIFKHYLYDIIHYKSFNREVFNFTSKKNKINKLLELLNDEKIKNRL